ncbi:hypothetical protein GCM10011335_45830 [Aureimonas glaciei]|uniref:Transposase n=2 Tax=Aureimonas glaciei TaxID=1776957 RepID=A0A917DGD2_9HYPH|nr:hypothetical protein GCM10011335_45830 [Aureimonas glaciei]
MAEMGILWAAAQHFLYSQFLSGCEWAGDIAIKHYADYGLSAKQWEHCWRDLMGRVASQRECDKLNTENLQKRVTSKRKAILASEKRLVKADKFMLAQEELQAKTDLAIAAGKKPPKKQFDSVMYERSARIFANTPFYLHKHKRKLDALVFVLEASRLPRTLCFGGRKLLNEQHHLEENGHKDHAEWKEKWIDARNGQFFIEGDAAYASGNQFVRLTQGEDGTFNVEIRLPERLQHLAETHGKSGGTIQHAIHFQGLKFEHGADEIRRALHWKLPISWRLMRDGDSWRIFAMITREYAEQEKFGGYRYSSGAVGVDVNVGHVSVTHVDRHGNPVETWNIPLNCYGKTQAQREDAVRKAAFAVVMIAVRLDLPIVSELLDFKDKKAQLRDSHGPRYARVLSSFAYSAFDAALSSACVRHSIHLRRVNPAYTSVIGDISYARRYGYSVHAAAGCVIARRAMRFSERLPSQVRLYRPRHADQVTLDHHEWNGPTPRKGSTQVGHVWSAWRIVARKRRAVLAGPSGPLPKGVRPFDSTLGSPTPSAKARRGGG